MSTSLHVFRMSCNIKNKKYSQCYFTRITCYIRFTEQKVRNYNVIAPKNTTGDLDAYFRSMKCLLEH